MGKIVLGYWQDIHGLASPIRLLLEIAGVDYEEKLYNIDDRVDWDEKKESLEFTYPNLPYIIDGDRKMTEHLPIMRYISRKFGLAPTTEDEIIISDQTESLVFDLRFRFYMVAYAPVEIFDDKKTEWLRVAHRKLNYLDHLLEKNKYVTGSRL
ncbi:Glutathione S-transferase B, partial [Pseudolycoriella hygida]